MQPFFHFQRKRSGVFDAPGGIEPGVHENDAPVLDQKTSVTKPVDEFVPVGRAEDVVERVLLVRRRKARGDGEKMQVVIAEEKTGPRSERTDAAQYAERFGTAVDEVAEKEKFRVVGKESEEFVKALEATLNVADGKKGRIRHGALRLR